MTRDIRLAIPIAPYPEKISEEALPSLSAEGVVLLEPKSFKTLYAKNENQKFYPASLTKLLTALTALDYYSLDQVLTVQKTNFEGQLMGLTEDEKISVKNLLYGLLVQSGNDAALVLADNEKVRQGDFVATMNKKARFLNMTNTHFTNPTGLDEVDHYSTPRDMAILGAVIMQHPLLSEIVKTKDTTVNNIDNTRHHHLSNVNSLIGEAGIDGIKTGFTEKANQCLLSHSTQGERSLIGVVLNSQDRFGETKLLLDWGYRVYRW